MLSNPYSLIKNINNLRVTILNVALGVSTNFDGHQNNKKLSIDFAIILSN